MFYHHVGNETRRFIDSVASLHTAHFFQKRTKPLTQNNRLAVMPGDQL
jgi:hypothetical protein